MNSLKFQIEFDFQIAKIHPTTSPLVGPTQPAHT